MMNAENGDAGGHTLPYDPEEWERKLAEARARREQVLQQRTAPQAERTMRAPIAPKKAAGTGTPAPERGEALARALRDLRAPAAGRPVPPPEVQPRPLAAPVRSKQRTYPRLTTVALCAGIVIGCGLTLTLSRIVAPDSAAEERVAAILPTEAEAAPPPPMPEPELVRPAPEPEPVTETAGPAPQTRPEPVPAGQGWRTETLDTTLSGQALLPPAPEPEAVPDPSLRIAVLAPRSVGSGRIGSVVNTVEQAGYAAPDSNRVGYTISRDQVRYYHAEDRAAAERLAGTLAAEARDFTHLSPPPDQGTVEVWLAGRSPTAVTRNRTEPPLADVTRAVQDLFRGVASQVRHDMDALR